MKVNILTDNSNSWIVPFIPELISNLVEEFNIETCNHIFKLTDKTKGDVLLALSCEKILKKSELDQHKFNLVAHPSKLPQGKGWSPLAWQILEGVNNVPITLFEVNEGLDSGDIYFVDYIDLKGHELNDEIKQKQVEITFKLIIKFFQNIDSLKPKKQNGIESFYSKRNKKSNELDVNKSIEEQFNLLRVVDNERYPAHFNLNGHTYVLKIEKIK
jgi:methionyl-tRNA formyltransferase